MDKILAIYDADVIYATRFAMYFKKKRGLDYEISAFTKKESLMSFLESTCIEILLLGEGLAPEEIPQDKVRWICLLSEHPPTGKKQSHLEVFKYQPVRLIISEVLSGYARAVSSSLPSEQSQSLKIISVFSPIPNAAKLYFAWSIGMLHSEYNKVLFVPMELFPVEVLEINENKQKSLSEFIYYLKESPNILTKLDELISYCNNLPYLSGLSHGFDLLAINKEDIKRFLEAVRDNSDYQVIVFYLGFYSEAVMELLQSSHQIFIPTGDAKYEDKVVKEWQQQIALSGQQINPEKVIKLALPQNTSEEKDCISLQELYKSPIWSIALQFLSK